MKRFRNWLTPFVAALCLPLTGCSSDDPEPTGESVAPVVTYQRVAIWHSLLQRYPDLPQKLETTIAEREQAREFERDGRTVEVRVHSPDGPVDFTARRIDVLVTDLSTESLRDLHRFLQTVPAEASRLGISQAATHFFAEGSGPRVLFLGADGRIEVKGPNGGQSQSINLYLNEVTKAAHLEVHTFGPAGRDAVPYVTEYLGANPVRGPPDAEVQAGHVGKPPPERLVVVVIGEIQNLDIAGPRDQAKQTIVAEAVVRGEVPAHSAAGRAAEAGSSSHAAKVVAVAAVVAAARAARSGGGSSGGSSGGGSSGGGRPRSGGRR